MLILSESIQDVYSPIEIPVSPERRALLCYRGKLLLEKFCGTNGNGICAESFAEYHLWRGEYSVVRDFLDYLQTKLITERDSRREEMTCQLIQRIQDLMRVPDL